MSPSEARPRVLLCTDGVFPHVVGGIQRHSRMLAEELARRGGVELSVVHPHAERVFDEALGIREIRVEPMPRRRHYLRELLDYSRRVHEVAMAHRDHVVYAQGMTAWHRARDFGARLVVNPHGLEFYQAIGASARLKAIPYRLAHRGIFRAASRVVSLGGRLTDLLRAHVPEASRRVVVIPNATTPPSDARVRERLDGPMRCLFVGRLARNKGADVLIEAARRLERAGEGFAFSVVGKGSLLDELGRDVPSSVRLLGFVADEDLGALYASHDVFVLPTLFEGMPTVVLEAMAHGMPVVVTDVGATRELVDERNGVIIARRDPDALVGALRRLRALPDAERAALSRCSLSRVRERFTWDVVAAQHEALFRQLASRG